MCTAPFDVEVEYPNGSTTTISSNQDTLEISGLAGSFGGNSYTITTLDVFDCSQTVSLSSSNLTTSFLVPINKMVMQLIVLDLMPPLFFLFKIPPSYILSIGI